MDSGVSRDYLMRNNIHLLFEQLAAEVIQQRPGQPVDFLLRRLKDMKEQTDGGTAPRIIFVLGGPGCGKGTQCTRLAEQRGFIHVSAGDLLRAEVQSGSERGLQIKEYIRNGQIVPGEVTIDLINRTIQEKSKGASSTFLIDGFPRELGQALAFSKEIAEPAFVLNFVCPDNELERRLLHRGQFSGRSDDNLESIKKRLKVFHKQTEPVAAYFDALGKVKTINSNRPIEEVAADVAKAFA
eukprot:TRINITY_DN16303_c0_g1_i1.p1 TRINITY_DN16303_c0_g1~~TRINITY_DN16303_c0_g1_i1.p1  ORF type:complete len:240 (+),score=89.70 TRINITY_DN16303_c0_g1_i1:90-809(+)